MQTENIDAAVERGRREFAKVGRWEGGAWICASCQSGGCPWDEAAKNYAAAKEAFAALSPAEKAEDHRKLTAHVEALRLAERVA